MYDKRTIIINAFVNKHIYPGNVEKDVYYESEESEPKFQETIAERVKLKRQRFSEIIRHEKDVNMELFQKYFNSPSPSQILRSLYNTNDKEKSKTFVDIIKTGLSDLKYENKKISEDEIKTGKPYKIVDIVEKILDFNNQKQKGQGLKILTPDQMLSRLPITLAQLKAGNNSEKLKNEIRQLLYLLYCSKKLTKTVYNILSILFKKWKQSL